MKKLSSLLLAGIFALSVSACGQESNITPIQDVQQTNTKVGTYSNSGLSSAFSALVQMSFKMADKNKDNTLSLDEYKFLVGANPSVPNPTQPPASEPNPVEDPATSQIATEVQSLAQKASIPADPTARFSKMDKNKNGKLTSSEVSALPSYFLPAQKTALRKAAKTQFDMFDSNKNKALSRDEFFKINMAGDSQAALNLQGMLFVTADVNNNGSLGFSEFEDIVYSSLRSYLSGTPNTSTPTPVAPPSEQPPQDIPSEPAPPVDTL